ncbi:MAG: Sir2 family NAD-dependent protein deacetylase [Actinomycetota bacterium]
MKCHNGVVDEQIADLVGLIAAADAIMIVTGAGVSTDSGIPDYRGPKGVWKTEQPVMYQDFVSDPDQRVEYWDQKLRAADAFNQAHPGAAHRACVELESAGKLHALVTQNVDGLHARAGTSGDRLVEVHGTAMEVYCLDCGERTPTQPHLDAFAESREAPICHCGGLLKPATISFGQQLDPMTMYRAQLAAEEADLVIALGSTLSVYPAAEIPLVAARRGVPYAIVNQGQTDHDGSIYLTLRIDGNVSTVFPQAVTSALTP